MRDPTSFWRRAKDGVVARGDLSYAQLLRSMAINANWIPRNVKWKQSYDWFDGLDDPYREMDFYVDGILQHATTASVLRINEGENNEAKAGARALLARLMADGMIVGSLASNEAARPYESYHNQYLVNAGSGRGFSEWQRDPFLAYSDVRLNDPKRWLTEYPMQGDFWNGTRSQSLINLPIPRKGASDIFVGPNFWNTTMYPVERMADDMNEALAWIIRIHKSANCHPGMSPALAMGMRSPDWTQWLDEMLTDDGGTVVSRRSQMVGSAYENGELRGEGYFRGVQFVERSIGYFPSRYALPMRYDTAPEAWDFDIRGLSNPLWHASGVSRQRKYYTGINGGEQTTADAVVDYAQIMMLLQYFVEMPPHVLLHSCMYFHNFLFRTSYNQIETEYGTSLAQYRQYLGLEYNATRATTNAVEKAASGFDFAAVPTSLEAATVQSLTVGIAAYAAGATGLISASATGVGLLAVGLAAVGYFIADASRAPPHYDPDPAKSVLRDQWRARGINTNFWRYYTPETVINSRPCIIYE